MILFLLSFFIEYIQNSKHVNFIVVNNVLFLILLLNLSLKHSKTLRSLPLSIPEAALGGGGGVYTPPPPPKISTSTYGMKLKLTPEIPLDKRC